MPFFSPTDVFFLWLKTSQKHISLRTRSTAAAVSMLPLEARLSSQYYLKATKNPKTIRLYLNASVKRLIRTLIAADVPLGLVLLISFIEVLE